MSTSASSFLIIQTAFIGDVILATALAEKLHQQFPTSDIDFLVRKGNEDLLKAHPYIRKVLVWDKKTKKIRNLLGMIGTIRKNRYDHVINVQRFFSSGLMTVLSGAKQTVGFDKNPLSVLFSKRVPHVIRKGIHETDRNQSLIAGITDAVAKRPALYPSLADEATVQAYKSVGQYICIAPTSVWFTKQYPVEKWVALLNEASMSGYSIYLLGAPGNKLACEAIRTATTHKNVFNLAGELSFLQSAALMKSSVMNYVNDSAPMHMSSSVNAPTTAVFCSTVTDFGFGPLSDKRFVVEIREELSCRPCGLHGYKACPQGHFKCALKIRTEDLVGAIGK